MKFHAFIANVKIACIKIGGLVVTKRNIIVLLLLCKEKHKHKNLRVQGKGLKEVNMFYML
jgi:hypothetical protein